MSKRRKFTVDKDIANEGREIANIVTNEIIEQSGDAKNERFNMRIPAAIAERLNSAAKKTGLTKTHIILSGLRSELAKIESE